MRIGFVLFENSFERDIALPRQYLSKFQGVEIDLVAPRPSRVELDCGCAVMPDMAFDDAADFDILCVPGGSGVVQGLAAPELLDFLAARAEQAQIVAAVGTGTFLLGGAGLLVGKSATTHPAYGDLLEEMGGRYVQQDVVADGNVITASVADAAPAFVAAIAERAGLAEANGAPRLPAALDRQEECACLPSKAEAVYASRVAEVRTAIETEMPDGQYTF
ncbi:DJ-1/PfpI family protein [Parasphingopyxis sp.]|uniref:DJ-1/PfpI family protein n=1 Tax=Parasphingopyxis sp. TaxID=1920299 RepID=UPI0026179AA3|nr:DJ-1/PfpI family protein [Parasphingopyxis sp.]